MSTSNSWPVFLSGSATASPRPRQGSSQCRLREVHVRSTTHAAWLTSRARRRSRRPTKRVGLPGPSVGCVFLTQDHLRRFLLGQRPPPSPRMTGEKPVPGSGLKPHPAPSPITPDPTARRTVQSKTIFVGMGPMYSLPQHRCNATAGYPIVLGIYNGLAGATGSRWPHSQQCLQRALLIADDSGEKAHYRTVQSETPGSSPQQSQPQSPHNGGKAVRILQVIISQSTACIRAICRWSERTSSPCLEVASGP